MPTRASIAIADHENQKSDVLVWVQDMGAANFASVTQDVDEIKDAVATISLGDVGAASITKTYPEVAGFPSDDPQAQRQTKWLVTYQDVMQFLDEANTIANPGYLKVFTSEIPCADLALLPEGKSELNLTDAGVVQAFVAAWEANVRSPYNHTHGHTTPTAAIKVTSIKFME